MQDIEKFRIAEKIQFYRKKAKLTQDDLAKELSLSRTTITAIEKGERKLKASEILDFARILGISISELTHQPPLDLKNYKIQFRKYLHTQSYDQAEELGLEEFFGYIEKYIELERKTSYRRLTPDSAPIFDKQEYSLQKGSKILADRERQRLLLGLDPILSIRDLLERELGLLVFYVPIENSSITAGYIFNDDVGGCIFVNKKHSLEKRRFALAHEYAHYLADRKKISIDQEEERPDLRREDSEVFADLFASHFLMPDEKVKQMFESITNATQKFTELDIAHLAVYFGVSFEAMTRKLILLNFLPKGVYEFMKRNGVKFDQLTTPFKEKSPLHRSDRDRSDVYPYMYQKMVLELFKKEEISEGQLSYYLGLDRLAIRTLLEKEEVTTPGLDLLHLNLR
ncbi:helix-turn-helix domain-containing protein [Leptospira kanakyensis]|uniref:helix-turn-helix domain-containing protein n=1 Tax=Leptospira kanakyensis TaxID=2484968 RepID=UPI00223CC509|nr:XRE family transcriptional regulator [Leptospira kanakyensis]MCW7470555.1 XRE family transcriptional regulator [Leptospira kanakyensis]